MKTIIFLVFIINLSFTVGCKYEAKTQENIDDNLFKAVKENNLRKVKELLEKGANANAISQIGEKPYLNETILGAAVYNKNVEIAQLLLENGADVNTGIFSVDASNGEKSISSNFSVAVSNQDVQMMKLIIEYKPNLDKDKTDSLTIFSAKTKEVLDLLIENGFDINSHDGLEVNILMRAIEANYHPTLSEEELSFIRAILAHHPKLDVVSYPVKIYGYTQLTALKMAKFWKRKEIIEELLKAGAKK